MANMGYVALGVTDNTPRRPEGGVKHWTHVCPTGPSERT